MALFYRGAVSRFGVRASASVSDEKGAETSLQNMMA
jgi:hypothetical protein